MADYVELDEQDEPLILKNGQEMLDAEQRRVMRELLKINPIYNSDYKWTEMAMGELFADVYRPNTLYCPEAKSWFIYDGTRWKRDTESLETMDRLMTFTKLLVIYSAQLVGNADYESKVPELEKMVAEYIKFLSKLFDRRARERIIKDAQTAAKVSINTFDRDEYLVNCQNATYDLRTGRGRPHSSKDYLTMITECDCTSVVDVVEFPRWDQFIDEITCGDKELADYLQRALGYSLLGRCKEECMFIAYGKTTRNGKGTLFNTIEKILGDYAKAMPADFICKTRYGDGSYDRPNPMLAGLKGKRFVTLSESDALGKLDEQAIKNFTGADPITTRNLHEKDFTFTPVFKIWLQCNTLPSVIDKSVFASDRLKVIPFNAHFDKDRRDTTLKAQFLVEDARKAIFKWLVDGYGKYRKDGLKEPKIVQEAVSDYELSNDTIQMFVDEQCDLGADYTEGRGNLYNSYKNWCRTNNIFILAMPKFKEAMEKFAKPILVDGNKKWKGIRLKPVTIQLPENSNG